MVRTIPPRICADDFALNRQIPYEQVLDLPTEWETAMGTFGMPFERESDPSVADFCYWVDLTGIRFFHNGEHIIIDCKHVADRSVLGAMLSTLWPWLMEQLPYWSLLTEEVVLILGAAIRINWERASAAKWRIAPHSIAIQRSLPLKVGRSFVKCQVGRLPINDTFWTCSPGQLASEYRVLGRDYHDTVVVHAISLSSGEPRQFWRGDQVFVERRV